MAAAALRRSVQVSVTKAGRKGGVGGGTRRSLVTNAVARRVRGRGGEEEGSVCPPGKGQLAFTRQVKRTVPADTPCDSSASVCVCVTVSLCVLAASFSRSLSLSSSRRPSCCVQSAGRASSPVTRVSSSSLGEYLCVCDCGFAERCGWCLERCGVVVSHLDQSVANVSVSMDRRMSGLADRSQ